MQAGELKDRALTALRAGTTSRADVLRTAIKRTQGVREMIAALCEVPNRDIVRQSVVSYADLEADIMVTALKAWLDEEIKHG